MNLQAALFILGLVCICDGVDTRNKRRITAGDIFITVHEISNEVQRYIYIFLFIYLFIYLFNIYTLYIMIIFSALHNLVSLYYNLYLLLLS